MPGSNRVGDALNIDPVILSVAARMSAARSESQPLIVGISGASCSGKSWLAEKIQTQHGRALIIGLDGYYRELAEVALLEYGHDNPASTQADRALEDLLRLKSGEGIDLPVYNYERQTVTGSRRCESHPLILVEGLFVFAHPALRAAFDIKIWIETEEELRWSRRMQRDTACRDLQSDDIRTRYERDVLPGYVKYIHPLRDLADIVIDNNGRDATDSSRWTASNLLARTSPAELLRQVAHLGGCSE